MKKIREKIIVACCSLGMCALGAGMLMNVGEVKAYAFEDIQLAPQYILGEIVTFPESGFVHESEYYKAETVLYYPNGEAKSITSEKFSIPGEYTLEYRAELDGKLYTQTYEFAVLEEVYSVSSSRSSVSYGLDDSQYETGLNGIQLSLAENNTFTYNKVLNLNELSDDSVISLMMLPDEKGMMEAEVVTVELTDAYNPSNIVYVQISAPAHPHNDAWSKKTGMLFAGTSPNVMFGAYGDRVRTAHDYWGYGYQFNFSFGDWSEIVGQTQAFFSFDLENKCLYGPDPQGDGVTSTLFADLSDDSIYHTEWEGFTTGEVYLSLSCSKYHSDVANILITKIGNEDLTADYFPGGIESTVEVDTLDYEIDSLPKAEVGRAYPLFQGTVLDFYQGELSLTPRVFYQYGTWMESEINVVNGTFIPDREGIYTIVYGHTDGFGNYVEKVLEVQTVDSVPPLIAELSHEKVTTAYLGVPVSMAEIQSEGGSGNHHYAITITDGEESVTLETKEYTFTKVGVYDVIFTVSDYLGNKATLSYQIEAVANPLPVATTKVDLPKYLIEGQKYVLPDCGFIDYSGVDAQKLSATITIKDGDGEHQLDGYEYIVKADGTGKVRVVYSASSSQGTTVLPEIEIPVIDVSGTTSNTIDLIKYFYRTEGMDIEANSSGIRLVASKDSSAEFINSLLADRFSLMLKIDESTNNFDAVNVRLTDSANENIQILVRFEKNRDKGITVYVNGKRLSGSILASYENGAFFDIEFSGRVLQIGGAAVYQELKRTVSGDTFNGFESGKLYCNVEIEGVKEEKAAVIIGMLNNQGLSVDMKEDGIGPQVFPKDSYQLVRSIGDTVTVFDAFVGDVLDNYTSATISVRFGGKPVVSIDGISLLNVPLKEYQFVVSEYGSYTIEYNVYDGKGNRIRGGNSYSVSVLDEVAPTLTVEGVPQVAKIGATVTLPKANVLDNITENIDYYVYVFCPNGTSMSCKEKMQFSATDKGVYTVVYLAVDAEGNLTTKRFDINVK